MTISRRPSKYSVENDPPPHELITLGVSLVSIEEYTFEQDGRTVTCPVEDEITYITVNKSNIEVPFNSCIKYDVVADILDTNGFPKKMWRIVSCWVLVPSHVADEIF